MNQPQLAGHPVTGISLLSFSYMLERLSYYGFRSIILLYFVSELHFERARAAEWYGTFTVGIYLSVLLGAFLGDFLIGAPAAIIVGGILEALGCFCVAIPGEYTALAGLFFIVLGTGLLKPNMWSQASSLYANRVRYMDAGFSILYLAVNVGAFCGPMIIGLAGEKINYAIGFCMAGGVALVSILPVLIDYKNQQNSFVLKRASKVVSDPVSIISLIGVLFLLPVFWAILETVSGLAYSDQHDDYFYSMIVPVIGVAVFTLISIILWSFVKLDPLYKIAIGFLLLVAPLALFLFYPAYIEHTPLLSALPEVLIVIPAYAVISRFAPPKLSGVFFGLSLSFSYLASKLTSFLGNLLMTEHDMTIYLLIGVCVFAVALFFILAKNLSRQNETSALS
jgi:POT family proton-dependent oligopeptide transporter